MSDDKHYHDSILTGQSQWSQDPILVAALVPEPPASPPAPPQVTRRRIWLPLTLFLVTCVSTFVAGCGVYELLLAAAMGQLDALQLLPQALLNYWADGLTYAVCVMTILACHEAGHFIQAWRYRVRASLPYFLPMPISPIGTFGAVIVMDSRVGDRRALFDIGITGPLAGLVPTLIFCALGIQDAHLVARPDMFGDPLLIKFLAWLKFGPLPAGHAIAIGKMGFAGWVGLLITSLNLMPIGQLDGGHILYGLLRKRAHFVATFLLLAAMVAVVVTGNLGWIVMLLLLAIMGPKHPPTADDNAPLGIWRILLGWLTLAFIVIGFTPTPFVMPN